MNHYSIAKEEMSFYGSENTSLQNLLAIIIGRNADPKITGELASLGAKEIASMEIDQLMNFDISKTTALRIHSAFQLAKQLNFVRCDRVRINTIEDAFEVFKYLRDYSQEHFVVAFLNRKNYLIKRQVIFIGDLSSCIVHPREVFREAVKVNAASIICAHQHPSGIPSPSSEDIRVTKRLKEVGDMMGIELLDHIIVGNPGCVSLKDKGYI